MTKTRFSDTIKAHIVAILLILILSGIYIYNMFANGPWYDELYTYYYFISRGPVYAAIHWPVPNNHVGYSVLSALLNYCGNATIGLRGISCLAAIANLVLIYRLCCRFMSRWYAAAAMALYADAYLPFRLAFQGRGYTLAVTCLLLAATAVYRISAGDCRMRHLVCFAASLTLGLYIVPSSIYWVIPVCLAGGLFLLMQKRIRDLLRLVLSGVLAAIATFFLYLLIWLAIGANLLCKDPAGAFYGLSQVRVILQAPITSARTGMDYMLASPYIQSIDRLECIRTMPGYFRTLLDGFYDRTGPVLLVLTLVVLVFCICHTVHQYRAGENYYLGLLLSCGIAVVPVLLVIQSVHPYLRVLSFYALFLAIGTVYLLHTALHKYKADTLVLITAAAIALISCFRPYYQAPLADRENEILSVLSQMDDPTEINNIFYTDDFQKYVLKFYYDHTPTEAASLEEAAFVITGPEFTDASLAGEIPQWPVLLSYSPELVDEVTSHMQVVARTDTYTIYRH